MRRAFLQAFLLVLGFLALRLAVVLRTIAGAARTTVGINRRAQGKSTSKDHRDLEQSFHAPSIIAPLRSRHTIVDLDLRCKRGFARRTHKAHDV